MPFDTTARRAARTNATNDQIEDIVIWLEDQKTVLTFDEFEALISELRKETSKIDAKAAASGAPMFSLGTGSPVTPTGTPADTATVATITLAGLMGLDATKLGHLMTSIGSPADLDAAHQAALGRMVPKMDLDKANAEIATLQTKIVNLSASLPAATTTVLAAADKAKVKKVIEAYKAGHKARTSEDWVVPAASKLVDADITAAEGVVA